MLSFVFGAFIAAGLANLGAQRADGLGVLTIARHGAGGKTAHSRAVCIKRDAACHHFDVFFLEACSEALIASGGARKAGFDAALVRGLGVVHWKLLDIFGMGRVLCEIQRSGLRGATIFCRCMPSAL
jgi:hypothetical protein